MLSDSRFGEYQLGMAVRYSRMVFRDEAAKQEAERAALSTEFGAPSHARTLASTLTSHTTATAASTEQRIAEGMNSAGVSYFGRLVTRGEGSAEGHQWISATRYGSVEDAHRGTAAVKEMLAARGVDILLSDTVLDEPRLLPDATRGDKEVVDANNWY